MGDNDGQAAAELQEIAATEAQPSYRLRFPPALEQRFEAATRRRRDLVLRAWQLFGALVALPLTLTFCASVLSPSLLSAAIPTFSLLSALQLVAAWAVRPRTPLWLESSIVIGTNVAGFSASLLFGALAPTPYSDHAIVGIATTMFVNAVVVPFRFRHCLAFAILGVFAYDTILLSGFVRPAGNSVDAVVFATLLTLIAIEMSFRQERTARKAFLAAARSQLLHNQLVRLSETDPLTTLANRRVFDRVMDHSWRSVRLDRRPLAVLLIDVDHFKAVNDIMGHAAGDRCLRAVAEILRANLRQEEDIAARYGGEEFVIMLPGLHWASALEVAERLRRAVERAALAHPHQNCVTISIGVAAIEPDSKTTSPETLLKAADRALYAAKAQGRNRVMHADVETVQ